MNKRNTFIVLLLFFIGYSDIIFAVQNKNLKNKNLTGPYFGQKPPGSVPEIFAPGIISTGDYERALVFSPDYTELYFQMRGRKFKTYLIHMKKNKNSWSKPKMAFFSGTTGWSDDYAFFSPDGNKLFFNSKRPIKSGGKILKEQDIWYMEKKNNKWGNPIHLPYPVNTDKYEGTPSIASNGNLYFCSNRDSKKNDWGIFVSKYKNGKYQKPEKLPAPIHSDKFEGHQYIAPDESYILFDSNRDGGYGDLDIYISYNIKGKWSKAINLVDKINTYSHENTAYVSPDGKYIFFTTFKLTPDKSSYEGKKFTYKGLKKILNSPGNGYGDIYWVSANIIEKLRPENIIDQE